MGRIIRPFTLFGKKKPPFGGLEYIDRLSQLRKLDCHGPIGFLDQFQLHGVADNKVHHQKGHRIHEVLHFRATRPQTHREEGVVRVPVVLEPRLHDTSVFFIGGGVIDFPKTGGRAAALENTVDEFRIPDPRVAEKIREFEIPLIEDGVN